MTNENENQDTSEAKWPPPAKKDDGAFYNVVESREKQGKTLLGSGGQTDED